MNDNPIFCRLEDIPDGGAIAVDVESSTGGFNLMMVRQGERVYAYHNECPHAGRRLDWSPGKFLVKEINVEIGPGALMGELGFLTPDNRRTGTIECIEDGQVLTITYDRLLEIYFRDPQFGYYFLVLTSQRLLQNIDRLQKQLATERAATTNRIA